MPDLLASDGVMTKAKPTAADRKDLAAAFAAAKAIGALDIGQAAVAIGGRVIAVEGIEGTDGLLASDRARCARTAGCPARSAASSSNAPSPDRNCVPTCRRSGRRPSTAAHQAGLAGIGVEAGQLADPRL